MERARRYQRLILLCALLGAAAAPSTIPAAYAEVAQVVVAVQRRAPRAERRAPEAAAPLAQASFRASCDDLPRARLAPPPAPLYVLHCSLLL